jgi:hypothetical protein
MTKVFIIPRMTDINKLLDIDAENATQFIRFFAEFSPELPEALEEVAQLFVTFFHMFDLRARDDDEQQVFNSCGKSLNASDGEELWSIMQSPLPQDPARAKIIKEAKAALDRMYSRRVRGQLLLLCYRSYMFAATDLLRLRRTPALGHFRVQIEAVGLMNIVRNEPTVASEWLAIVTEQDGKRFFDRYKKRLSKFNDLTNLAVAYNLASGSAQHARLASIALGLSQRIFEERGRQVEQHYLKFQEADPERPYELIMWALFFLETQYKLFLAMIEALPEVTDPILIDTRLPNFRLKVTRLWKHLEKKYPHQVAKWRKEAAGIGKKSGT